MARKRHRKKNDSLIVTVLAYIVTAVIFFYILRWIFRLVFSPAVIGTVVVVALIVGIYMWVKRRAASQEEEDYTEPDVSVLPVQSPAPMPARPLNEIEQMQISTTIKQIGESKKLVRNTVTPSVFFGRLNFCLDALLFLQQFEEFGVFGEATPTKDYKIMLDHLESTVDSFIDRALENNRTKRSKLKTYEGQYHNYEKFLISLISAFDCADGYWSGNSTWPHYTGPLYTGANYQRVQSLYDGLDELYDPIIQAEIDSITNKQKQ